MNKAAVSCVLACVVLLLTVQAQATLVTFAIEPDQSTTQAQVRVRTDGVTYDSTPQRAGSDMATLSGTITADVTLGTRGAVTAVRFLDSNFGFIPAPGLSQPGDQTATFGLINGPYTLAVHDVSAHLQSGHYESNGSSYTFVPETLAVLPGGSIVNPSSLFLNDATALVDIGNGSTTLTPNLATTGPDQNVSSAAITIVNDHGTLRLDIPNYFASQSSQNPPPTGDYVAAVFSGRTVATAIVPEPTSISLAFLGALSIVIWRRVRF